MELKELRLAMEKAKAEMESGEPREELSVEEMRERTMQEFLDSVSGVSQFINEGFQELNQRRESK